MLRMCSYWLSTGRVRFASLNWWTWAHILTVHPTCNSGKILGQNQFCRSPENSKMNSRIWSYSIKLQFRFFLTPCILPMHLRPSALISRCNRNMEETSNLDVILCVMASMFFLRSALCTCTWISGDVDLHIKIIYGTTQNYQKNKWESS